MTISIGQEVRLENLGWRFRVREFLDDGERVVLTRIGSGPESFNSSVVVDTDIVLPANAESPPARRPRG